MAVNMSYSLTLQVFDGIFGQLPLVLLLGAVLPAHAYSALIRNSSIHGAMMPDLRAMIAIDCSSLRSGRKLPDRPCKPEWRLFDRNFSLSIVSRAYSRSWFGVLAGLRESAYLALVGGFATHQSQIKVRVGKVSPSPHAFA
jgi:hypothetical protein